MCGLLCRSGVINTPCVYMLICRSKCAPFLFFLSTAVLEFKSRNGLWLAEENVRLCACALRGSKAMDSSFRNVSTYEPSQSTINLCDDLKISVQAHECPLLNDTLLYCVLHFRISPPAAAGVYRADQTGSKSFALSKR